MALELLRFNELGDIHSMIYSLGGGDVCLVDAFFVEKTKSIVARRLGYNRRARSLSAILG